MTIPIPGRSARSGPSRRAVSDRLWAGTMPGGLFRSDDGGDSWSLNESLWRMPERQQWMGVAGGEQPGIHSVLVDPHNPSDIRIGGVGRRRVGRPGAGASWTLINRGMHAEYFPPERCEDPIVQDVHRLARCALHPEIMWCQHHNRRLPLGRCGATWREMTAIRPSKFGFAVAAHPSRRRHRVVRAGGQGRTAHRRRRQGRGGAHQGRRPQLRGAERRPAAAPRLRPGVAPWPRRGWERGAWPSARPPAACGSPKTAATPGRSPMRVCRRSPPCALRRRNGPNLVANAAHRLERRRSCR